VAASRFMPLPEEKMDPGLQAAVDKALNLYKLSIAL
jgi:hypothetical protein